MKEVLVLSRLLNAREVSEILGINLQQVYRYVRQGVLSECTVHIGKSSIRFDQTKLKECIERGNIGHEV